MFNCYDFHVIVKNVEQFTMFSDRVFTFRLLEIKKMFTFWKSFLNEIESRVHRTAKV